MEAMFMRLTKSITESFIVCIANLVTAIEDKINVKIDVRGTEIFSQSRRLDKLEKRIDDLVIINNSLTTTIQEQARENQRLKQAVDNLEQYTRADSILIHGLLLPQPGTTENLYTKIPSVLNNLIPNI